MRELLTVDSRSAVPTTLQFRDVASQVGVRFQRFNDTVPDRYYLPEVMGGGVAWIDYDSDGLFDLYAVDGCRLWEPEPGQTTHVNRMFRNGARGHFRDVTFPTRTGDNRYGQGCAVADYDGDGFSDLYVANFGRNTLLFNRGDGTFDDVTESAGVGDAAWGTSAAWLDADEDGCADLYVVNYVHLDRHNHRVCTYGGVEGYCGPGQWEGVADVLYLNRGDGGFDVAPPAEGVSPQDAKGLAVAAADFDGDARPEIYVANDMMPNFLLDRRTASLSQPGPLYHNVAVAAGCAVSGAGRNEASMGVACADFDGDGLVDIFLTHYHQQKNTLYRNLGGLLFEDDSYRSRAAVTSFETLGFGVVPADFDHDGDADLFVANGHVLGPRHVPNEMRPQLFENNGSAVFDDAGPRAGDYFLGDYLGRGAAGGDFNNDGRIDVAVSHLDRPLALLMNDVRSRHHFVGVELRPADRVYPAGGRVVVTAGARQWFVPIVSGGSYLSSSDPRFSIGLGDFEGPVDIEVAWPGRSGTTYTDLPSNRYWILTEAGGAFSIPHTADVVD